MFPIVQTEAELRQAELIGGGPIDKGGWHGLWVDQGTRIWHAYMRREVDMVCVKMLGVVVVIVVVRTRSVRQRKKQSLANQVVNTVQPPSKRGAMVGARCYIPALAPNDPLGSVMPDGSGCKDGWRGVQGREVEFCKPAATGSNRIKGQIEKRRAKNNGLGRRLLKKPEGAPFDVLSGGGT